MFTTDCGHKFCKKCITQYAGDHGACKCPMCRKHVCVKEEPLKNKIYKYIKKYIDSRKPCKIIKSLIKRGYEVDDIEIVFALDFNVNLI